MNYILEKSNKQVIWINADSNQMTGVDAWANFNPNKHEIVYSLHYNPKVGESFLAEIKNGIAQDFEPRKVYNKISKEERILQSWEDGIDTEKETEHEPLKDLKGIPLTYQKHFETGWKIDLEERSKILLAENTVIFNSKSESYRGFVSYLNTSWDSGIKYLENIRKTLSLHSKQKLQSIPEWRDAENSFHSLGSEELTELADLIEVDLFQAGNALYGKKWEIEAKIQSLPQNQTLNLVDLWK
ncbi:DUF4376 domain-containing protein [Leptospira interrogans]|uniref:DUF4376 domain-containing protein n=1 Tax=Leptospira interrogans TaxID=173 RepID=UPI001F10B30A|nr:DUF4376 domain-containing protein [Leptospira interrogans]UMQ59660.1 DUF4376 domain-containing protein [Leptospira interrogans]UNE68581.1 DUF4376 domain-containing protein [Leptospira interrogans]